MNTATKTVDRYLLVNEIRDRLGCSLSYAYEVARQCGYRPGPAGCRESDLEAFLARRQGQPGPDRGEVSDE